MCRDKFSISLTQQRIFSLCYDIQTAKMDILNQIFVFIVFMLLIVKDVAAFTISASRSADKAVFGNNQFTISCEYTIGTSEVFYYVTLGRKRKDDSGYTDLITFQPPNSVLNTTYTAEGELLKSRTVATGPTSGSLTASFQFNSIECDDKGEYQWLGSYSDGSPKTASASVEIVVKAITTFAEDVAPPYTPKNKLEAGINVTFTCEGDVGNEPVGQLAWFYYLNGNTVGGTDLSSNAVAEAPILNLSTCSYTRRSTLKVTLTRLMNQMVMRCTVQQDVAGEHGDKHRQTDPINVEYPPILDAITSSTGSFSFTEGSDSVTFSCIAESNPPSFYYWIQHAKDNTTQNTIQNGNQLTLANLTEDDSGRNFSCVAYVTINGVNKTDTKTVQIVVSEQTTTPVQTTTTPSSSSAETTDDGVTPAPSTSKAGADTTTIIIIVVVVVVVLIAALVGFGLYWRNKKKKSPEIEEPPDKPRNNRDLTFSSNRPDLVSSEQGMKNNALNTSFNSYDSTDMKPPREDGLMYIDLQFDDKPRSRRPIQILDNGSGSGSTTPYADIAMPRV